ncbi:MAG: hypothetical protein C5B52_09160 [Bacteroidetes bacterium]|nr:MAG: hypothetical protein C5B52_09160 [Bacteroidota bacterium]
MYSPRMVDIEAIRKNYGIALSNRSACREMIVELEHHSGTVTELAYLGGFQTIWANHVINPFSKLKTFNDGISNIEKAVGKDPSNVEVRFVRLSVQKNCPRILGYHNNVNEDRVFLLANKWTIQSAALAGMIESLLNGNKE